jgi:hypothetical protein
VSAWCWCLLVPARGISSRLDVSQQRNWTSTVLLRDRTPPVAPGVDCRLEIQLLISQVDSARCIRDATRCISRELGRAPVLLREKTSGSWLAPTVDSRSSCRYATRCSSPFPHTRRRRHREDFRRVVIAGIRALSTRRDAIFGSLFLVPCSFLPSFPPCLRLFLVGLWRRLHLPSFSHIVWFAVAFPFLGCISPF